MMSALRAGRSSSRRPPRRVVAISSRAPAGVVLGALLFTAASGCARDGRAPEPSAATTPPPDGAPVAADLSGTDPEIAALLTELLQKARDEPDVGRHRGALGMAYEVNGLTQAAAASYAQALALEPAEPRWSYFLAQVQAQQGQLEEALASLEPATRAQPPYLPAWLYRGEWLIDLGRLDEARAAYARALELQPGNRAATFGMARIHLAAGAPAEAATLLEGLARDGGADPYLNQLLGLAYRDAGDLDRARSLLARAAPAREPGWPDPWHDEKATYQAGFGAGMVKAETLLDSGKTAEAITVLESLRRSRPDDLALLNNLSVAYRQVGQADRALEVLLQGVEAHPDYYPFHLNLSAAYQRRGDMAKAIEHLDRVIAIYPTLAEAHDRKGRIYLDQRRLDEALQCFDTALQYDASRPNTLLAAAVIEAELGHWPRAAERAEQTVRLDPRQAVGYIVLGRARAELGSYDEAAQALDQAERLQPGNRALAATRQRLAQLRGRPR